MTAGATSAPTARNRRVERNRRQLELLLDAVFRPGCWAARAAWTLGLQGRIQVLSSDTDFVPQSVAARPVVALGLRLRLSRRSHHRHASARRGGGRASRLPAPRRFARRRLRLRTCRIHRAARSPLGELHAPLRHVCRAWQPRSSCRLPCRDQCAGSARRTLLTNAHHTLAAPFDDVTLCGLDDPTRGEPRADLAMDGATGTRIVLMHSPEGFRRSATALRPRAVWTHARRAGRASVRSPLLVPGGPLNRRYHSGLYHLGGGDQAWAPGCSFEPRRGMQHGSGARVRCARSPFVLN